MWNCGSGSSGLWMCNFAEIAKAPEITSALTGEFSGGQSQECQAPPSRPAKGLEQEFLGPVHSGTDAFSGRQRFRGRLSGHALCSSALGETNESEAKFHAFTCARDCSVDSADFHQDSNAARA